VTSRPYRLSVVGQSRGESVARPAGLEPAAPGLEGRWDEANGGSGTPLLPVSSRSSHALSRRPWRERGALGLLLLSRVEPAPLDQRRRATRRAERRPGRGALAMTQEERIRAVVDCGFAERQARFLVLVMRHGGVCIPRQYAGFAGIAMVAGDATPSSTSSSSDGTSTRSGV
jgi:hypothetical protein